MPSIDRFCDRMRYWCDEGNLGYCQTHRWNIYEGGEADCSSLVIFALREAGFKTGDASYTGNMASELCAHGWVRCPNNGNPSKGMILLNERCHVAAWLGDCLAQASINELGTVAGGEPGDQTDRETNTRSYYNYPWDFYLEYFGGSSGGEETPVSGGSLDVDGLWGSATTRALQKALGTYADGIVDGQYAGNRPHLKACTIGWCWDVSYGTGSPMVKALQRIIGCEADGVMGPDTVRALQTYLGFDQSGTLAYPSETVAEMQRRLNTGTL